MIITICLVHFYFTYLIWQEDKEVLTLSSYFLLGLSTFKAWKWITNRTDWDKMETQFGVQTIEKLVRDDGVYIRGKGLLVGLVKLFGARNFLLRIMGVRYINRLSDIYCIGTISQIDALTAQAIKKAP